ncbi:MAG: acyl-CoA dehydrogenase, partial [Proteobacteria bacterium]|nr:acyl-CoA dehydrogenase [Pseudomonadota bacterium]
IHATLEVAEQGRYELSGTKTWASIGPDAAPPAELLVVATLGPDHAGRPQLRVARIDAAATGVAITRTAAPFVPEIPHATVTFTRVDVHHSYVLPGDGYVDYLKPFRTIEDIQVHGAILGYLVGVARRHAFVPELVETLLALADAGRALAVAPPRAAETHRALAGTLALVATAVADVERAWAAAPDDEWIRWQRDRPLLAVAGKARLARRDRARQIEGSS